MARRRKPHDPAARSRAQAEAERIRENAQMAEATGATVRRDKAGRVTSIYRQNVLTVLGERGVITPNQRDAGQRLFDLWAIWKGLEGRNVNGEVIDGGAGAIELVTDRMIRAGRDVAEIMASIGPLNAKLLARYAFEVVEANRPVEWRLIVQDVCGCADRDKQSAYVVGALENLRLIFEAPRKRAA